MHFVVHDYVMLNNSLTLQEKCLFSYIEGFHDNQEKTFYASNKHLSKLFNVTTRRISSIISSLTDKGYLVISYKYVNNTKEIQNRCISINPAVLNEMRRGGEESFTGGSERSFVGVVKEVSTNNKEDIIKKKKEFAVWYKTYPRKTGKASALDYWIKNYNHIKKNINVEHCKKAYLETEKQFIPHPVTYLRQERWDDEVIKHTPKSKKINLKEYKMSTSGHFIGYCMTCNESSFYKEWDLKGDSSCCDGEIKPEKKNGTKRQSLVYEDKRERAVI